MLLLNIVVNKIQIFYQINKAYDHFLLYLQTCFEPRINLPNLSDSQNDIFTSTNPMIDDAKEVRIASAENKRLQISKNQDTSPKNNVEAMNYRRIEMVTSTPLLTKSTTSNNVCTEDVVGEQNFEKHLFDTQASGVKAAPQFLAQKLQFTPNPIHMRDMDSAKLKSVCAFDKNCSDLISAENLDSNEQKNITNKYAVIAPKVLNFENTPSKFTGAKIGYSVDMFDDLSLPQPKQLESILEVSPNQQDMDSQVAAILHEKVDSIKVLSTDGEPIVNLASDSELNKNEPRLSFKVPAIMSRAHLIPVKKGGKNWRRTMMCASKRSSSDILSKQCTAEVKSLARVSSSAVELTRSNIRIAQNDNMSKIAENLIKEKPQAISICELENMSVSVREKVENDQFEMSLDTSNVVGKSSSYIMPIGQHNESIIGITGIDIVTKVLLKCSQERIILFDKLHEEEVLINTKKVGEGSYGEVFLLNYNGTDPSVLKIVPVDGNALVNGEPQTKLSDMLAEIVVSTELTRLKQYQSNQGREYASPNFITLRKCTLVHGNYPSRLLELWDQYNEIKCSENERPDAQLFHDELCKKDQRFIALEYDNGGNDLENAIMKNARQGLSIFLQVAHAMAGTKNQT